MTTIPSIVAGAGADVVATGNFNAVSPAGMYGRKPSTSSGRVWGYFGGIFDRTYTIADGTITASASTTTYVVGDKTTGAVTSSTATTNWNDSTNYFRIALLVADASNITNNSGLGVDHRDSVYGSAGSGGGGGTPGGSTTQIQYNDTGSFAGDADFTWDAANNRVNTVNITATGLVLTAASASGGAGFRLPHGAAPSAPTNGDLWTTTAGLYARINGATVGPFGTGGGGGGGVTIDTTLSDLITGTSTLSGVDPNADRIWFWDDSAGKATFLTVGAGLSIVGTTLSASGGSGITTTSAQTLSGTSIDFTGLPAAIKRITVQWQTASGSGTSNPMVQIGDSGGPKTSGYSGTAVAATTAPSLFSTGFWLSNASSGAGVFSGHLVLTRLSGNLWVASGMNGYSSAAGLVTTAGSAALTNDLDRIRLTFVNGTDVWDSGTASVMYEL